MQRHDMTEVRGRGKGRSVRVHYDGMTKAIEVKGGVIVGSDPGLDECREHAIGEARAALARLGDQPAD